MLESGKELEEEQAGCKTSRERATVGIVKTNKSMIGGALDKLDAGDCWVNGVIRRWKK